MKKIIISVLFSLAVQANTYGKVDPETHNLCKDAIDYMGCVKVNKKNNNWNLFKKNNKSQKVKIKGIYCGSDNFMNFLKTNLPLEEIYTNDPENIKEKSIESVIDEILGPNTNQAARKNLRKQFELTDFWGYNYLVDINSGQIYQESWESSDDQYVVEHLYMNAFQDNAFLFESEKSGNILKIKTRYYEDRN